MTIMQLTDWVNLLYKFDTQWGGIAGKLWLVKEQSRIMTDQERHVEIRYKKDCKGFKVGALFGNRVAGEA